MPAGPREIPGAGREDSRVHSRVPRALTRGPGAETQPPAYPPGLPLGTGGSPRLVVRREGRRAREPQPDRMTGPESRPPEVPETRTHLWATRAPPLLPARRGPLLLRHRGGGGGGEGGRAPAGPSSGPSACLSSEWRPPGAGSSHPRGSKGRAAGRRVFWSRARGVSPNPQSCRRTSAEPAQPERRSAISNSAFSPLPA